MLTFFQQVPEVHDRDVFGDRVAQGKPVLQQVNAQHGLHLIGFVTYPLHEPHISSE